MNLPTLNQNYDFYFCYSINLLRFLRNNGLENIAKGINPKTQKTYWMFQRSNKLDTYLTQWNIQKTKQQPTQ